MVQKRFLFVVAILLLSLISVRSYSQCGGIMEPGFAFLTSSRGCAPFTVNIQTLYLSSVPGTEYFINWGDGTPEETYTQVAASGCEPGAYVSKYISKLWVRCSDRCIQCL
jgi:hypothetical protein